MTPAATLRPHTSPPRVVVLAAYAAANLGQYRRANSYVSPTFIRSLARTHEGTLALLKRAEQSLKRLRGQRGTVAVQMRKHLRQMVASQRAFAGIQLGSARQLRQCWDSATRNRSLERVEAVRQVVRDTRARVYLKLTYRSGAVVRDSEPLVLEGGRWLLG